MILILAWRNIWRNRTRSLVVISAIAVGIIAVLFLSGFSRGMVYGYIDNAIESQTSHVQIHHPEFLKERDIHFQISQVEQELETVGKVKAFSPRCLSSGMLSSTKGARGIRIIGIDPAKEAKVTRLDEKIVEGKFLQNGLKNPILVGKSLAEKLKLKLRSKIVLTFQNLDGDITSAAFRIVGLFDTGTRPFDEGHIYLLNKDIVRLLLPASSASEQPLIHEVALLVDDLEALPAIVDRLKKQKSDWLVRDYKEISPEISLYESQIDLSTTIFTIIVMLALIFGIINTMLMAVLERLRELGMLMAIGMNKLKIFLMIVLETILLGIVATPLGLGIGYLAVHYFRRRGIDLSAYSEGMREIGMSEVIFPVLDGEVFLQIGLAVAITAILASLYPAWKAIRLQPVEAMRSI